MIPSKKHTETPLYFQTGEEVQQSGFSLKSVSSLIFGQETLESRQEKMMQLEDQMKDAEEVVKIAENDVK